MYVYSQYHVDLLKCTQQNVNRVLCEPGESGETGKWHLSQEKTGNNVKTLKIWGKLGLSLYQQSLDLSQMIKQEIQDFMCVMCCRS